MNNISCGLRHLKLSLHPVTALVKVPVPVTLPKSVCCVKWVGCDLSQLQCCEGTGTVTNYLVSLQQNAEPPQLCLPHRDLRDQFCTVLALALPGGQLSTKSALFFKLHVKCAQCEHLFQTYVHTILHLSSNLCTFNIFVSNKCACGKYAHCVHKKHLECTDIAHKAHRRAVV
jgi:hypothetical protein